MNIIQLNCKGSLPMSVLIKFLKILPDVETVIRKEPFYLKQNFLYFHANDPHFPCTANVPNRLVDICWQRSQNSNLYRIGRDYCIGSRTLEVKLLFEIVGQVNSFEVFFKSKKRFLKEM